VDNNVTVMYKLDNSMKCSNSKAGKFISWSTFDILECKDEHDHSDFFGIKSKGTYVYHKKAIWPMTQKIPTRRKLLTTRDTRVDKISLRNKEFSPFLSPDLRLGHFILIGVGFLFIILAPVVVTIMAGKWFRQTSIGLPVLPTDNDCSMHDESWEFTSSSQKTMERSF
jgi:hypothetical protein